MKKILSLTLVVMLLISVIPTAFAAEAGGNWAGGTEVEYTGTRSTVEDDGTVTHDVEYTITVPAKLAPAGSGTVTLEGMWPSDATVKVTADPSVEMVNSINSADKKTLAVTFAGITLAGNNTVAVSDDETVSVADISAALFGTWSGKFNYNVDYVAGSGNTGSGTTEPSDPDTGDGEEATVINFAITGYQQQAEDGMTWQEWIESDYNTDGWFVSSDNQIHKNEDTSTIRLTYGDYTPVAVSSKVQANNNYLTEVVNAATLITFTIDGTEYQAEENMTWHRWVASEYNSIADIDKDTGAVLIGDLLVYPAGDIGNLTIQKSVNIIRANAQYVTHEFV